ncbi:MAG TPA: PTS sugar transporter subunit IIC [Acholeplasmataceae bacterium]|nr:PTS sugar transporter subunit IIC [Acholeplasmataceae bacterium]
MKEKSIKRILKDFLDYLIKTFNGMAFGLFSTLIVGTIINTLGELLNFAFFQELATLLKNLTGVGIGIGIAWSLKLDGLRLIAAGIAGGIASNLKIGDPMVEFLTVIIAIELLNLIFRRKTFLDIILIPLTSSIIAYGCFLLLNKPVSEMMRAIGEFIKWATTAQPFFMGIIIAVLMGMLLTAPISSAAIAIAIGLDGLAGGAAVVGCSVQMLGFAVMSRKDNKFGTVISVAFGTSMLQFKNILKKPLIWLPTIIVSAILGPLATLVFNTTCTKEGSGMGTSGLVGQIGTFYSMGKDAWLSILILQIIFPILLVWILDALFRKKGWIKTGDLKI